MCSVRVSEAALLISRLGGGMGQRVQAGATPGRLQGPQHLDGMGCTACEHGRGSRGCRASTTLCPDLLGSYMQDLMSHRRRAVACGSWPRRRRGECSRLGHSVALAAQQLHCAFHGGCGPGLPKLRARSLPQGCTWAVTSQGALCAELLTHPRDFGQGLGTRRPPSPKPEPSFHGRTCPWGPHALSRRHPLCCLTAGSLLGVQPDSA